MERDIVTVGDVRLFSACVHGVVIAFRTVNIAQWQFSESSHIYRTLFRLSKAKKITHNDARNTKKKCKHKKIEQFRTSTVIVSHKT
jgi:arginine exporter protein ArgO